MVDFWNTLARIVTNDPLRKQIFDRFSTGLYHRDCAKRALIISGDHYDELRRILAKDEPKTPVSLATLGELLFTISCESTRRLLDDMAKVIKRHLSAPASALLLTGLGVLIVDESVRGLFRQGGFASVQLGGLEPAEKTLLTGLAKDKHLSTLADMLCDKDWRPDCLVKFNFYSNHVHVVASFCDCGTPPELIGRKSR